MCPQILSLPYWKNSNNVAIIIITKNTISKLRIICTLGLYVCAKSLQSCPALCDPMDCSPPSSSVHGILQTRILEWIAMPSFRGSSWPRDWTPISCVSCFAGIFFTAEPPGRPSTQRWTSYSNKCCTLQQDYHGPKIIKVLNDNFL